MKTLEIRDLDTEELHARISELKEELFNLRFQKATGQLDNHRRIRQVKKDVARIRTVLRERDFAVAEAAGRPVEPAAATAPVTAPTPRDPNVPIAPEPAEATPDPAEPETAQQEATEEEETS
jgi:large subunit ribosomal protein L29